MENNKVLKGSVYCMIGASLWGISGAAGQYLFSEVGITPEWLVTVRLLTSGIVLLLFLQWKEGSLGRLWRNKRDSIDLVMFGILGILMAQYTYFVTIDLSNAATATVLQYLSPIMIVVFLIFYTKKRPLPMEVLAVGCALTGTFLLATHGDVNTLNISPKALIWGLLSAVAMAFYTAFPRRLLTTYNTLYVVGWAMLVGGICMNFIHPIWRIEGTWDLLGIGCVVFAGFFGSLVPCVLFMSGIRIVGPTKASLFTSMEPLAATVVSVFWLKTQLMVIDYVGFFLIIITVFLLTGGSKEKTSLPPEESVD